MRIFIVVVAILTLAPRAEAQAWKAGLAKAVITPEKLMWMSGYGARKAPAEGKLTDLWAKALVLEDPSGKRAVLVTLDLVGIGRDLSVPICQAIQDKHGIPRERIILSVSHTHCGPVVGHNLGSMYSLDDTQRQLVKEYTEFLPRRIMHVVGEAVKDVTPAKLSWDIGKSAFAVNRRTNKEGEVPALKEAGALKGPVDHDAPVLAVRDMKDGLRGVIFGYACHATVLSFQLWCGDYPGFAQAELEKRHPGAIAMFWAGCGADQNPLPRRSVALAEKYGKELADAVTAVLKGATMKAVSGPLSAAYTEVKLPFDELPSRERVAADALSKDKYVAARARALLETIKKNGALPADYPYPVQTWRLGDDLEWITLGGEVVVDFSLRLKKELHPGRTWVMGYANDVMAYIPSLRVLKEGGYEGGGAMVYYGLPTVWGPRVEEIIVGAVHDQVKRAKN